MIGPGTFPSGQVPVPSAGPHLAALEADLGRVADLAIYFGHQSVGRDLLDGVSELASPFPNLAAGGFLHLRQQLSRRR